MSIPRVVLMVGFGLISSSGRMDEPIVKAAAQAAAATQAQRGRAQTVTVRIHVLPQAIRSKDQAAIESWLRARGRIRPWDIIVDGRKTWMFIHDTLVEHKNDHDNYHFEHGTVHLSVGRHDQIRWESDQAFEIDIQKDDHPPRKPDAPANPFPGKWPMASGKGYRVESGPPVPGSVGQRYKAIVTIGGVRYDPDLVCEP